MIRKRRLPRCLGYFDVESFHCNGDDHAETLRDKEPCLYRDRCAGLQRHCVELSRDPDHFLTRSRVQDDDGKRRTYSFSRNHPGKFEKLLARQMERWNVFEGIVRNREAVLIEKEISPRKNPKMGTSKFRSKYQQIKPTELGTSHQIEKISMGLRIVFVKELESELGCRLRYNKKPEVGGYYYASRDTLEAQHVQIFSRGKDLEIIDICMISLIRSAGALRCFFGAPFREIGVGQRADLAIRNLGLGVYRAETCNLGEEGARIAARTVAWTLDRQIVKVPGHGKS